MKQNTRQQSKRSYGSFFRKTFALMLATAFVVGIIACWGFYQYDFTGGQNQAYERVGNIREWLLDPENTDPCEVEIRTQLSTRFAYSEYSFYNAAVLYDRQTGRTYDSTPIIWCFAKIRADGEYMDALDDLIRQDPQKYDYLNQFDSNGNFSRHFFSDDPALLGQIEQYMEQYHCTSCAIDADAIYVKDDRLYLENPTLDLYQFSFSEEPKYTFIMETSMDIPEDAVQFMRKNMKNPENTPKTDGALTADALFLIRTGTDPESPALKAVYDYMKWCQETGNFYESDENEISSIPIVRELVHRSGEPIDSRAENPRWELYTVTYFNFLEAHAFHFLVIGSGLFLLLLVLSLLIAKIRYVQYCKEFELNEYRKNLTASLAHDLKTPLASISGYAENLLENVHTEKRESYANSIRETADYMNGIITDVLDLAKLEQKTDLKTKSIDLTAIAEEAAAHFADAAAEKGLTVKISGKCKASANQKMMTQAVTNLMENAVRYTPQGGSITVTGSDHALKVENTAETGEIGDAAKLSEPFVKGDSARGARTGSGLGLSIVRQICTLHGFRLELSAKDHAFIAEILF